MASKEQSWHSDPAIYQRLRSLEQEQVYQQKAVRHLRSEFHQIRQHLMQQIHPDPGYVIRLQFSPTSPVHEWEDQRNGWRIQGQGSRYRSLKRAEERLAELRLMWSEYPLEVHFCK